MQFHILYSLLFFSAILCTTMIANAELENTNGTIPYSGPKALADADMATETFQPESTTPFNTKTKTFQPDAMIPADLATETFPSEQDAIYTTEEKQTLSEIIEGEEESIHPETTLLTSSQKTDSEENGISLLRLSMNKGKLTHEEPNGTKEPPSFLTLIRSNNTLPFQEEIPKGTRLKIPIEFLKQYYNQPPDLQNGILSYLSEHYSVPGPPSSVEETERGNVPLYLPLVIPEIEKHTGGIIMMDINKITLNNTEEKSPWAITKTDVDNIRRLNEYFLGVSWEFIF